MLQRLEIQVDGHSKSFVDDDAEAWGGKIREMRKNTEEVKKDIASMNEQIKRLTDMVADERARVKIDDMVADERARVKTD